jgi:hypothetical protein
MGDSRVPNGLLTHLDGSTEATTTTVYEACVDPAMREALLGSMKELQALLQRDAA